MSVSRTFFEVTKGHLSVRGRPASLGKMRIAQRALWQGQIVGMSFQLRVWREQSSGHQASQYFSYIAQLLGRGRKRSVLRGVKDSTGTTYHAFSGGRKATRNRCCLCCSACRVSLLSRHTLGDDSLRHTLSAPQKPCLESTTSHRIAVSRGFETAKPGSEALLRKAASAASPSCLLVGDADGLNFD
jgi:hypothetical protein